MPFISTLIKMWPSVLTMAVVAIAHGQALTGAKLVEALQHGGYVMVMRHASFPQAPPTKEAANPDNSGDERQLENGES